MKKSMGKSMGMGSKPMKMAKGGMVKKAAPITAPGGTNLNGKSRPNKMS